MPVMSDKSDVSLPAIPFWLLNAILLCAAYWVAVVLLSPDLMAEVLALPDSGARGYFLALAPSVFCLILALRGRIVRRVRAWAALILAAFLINAAAFFIVGVLTEEGVRERPAPTAILA
jgi:amino acid permease